MRQLPSEFTCAHAGCVRPVMLLLTPESGVCSKHGVEYLKTYHEIVVMDKEYI